MSTRFEYRRCPVGLRLLLAVFLPATLISMGSTGCSVAWRMHPTAYQIEANINPHAHEIKARAVLQLEESGPQTGDGARRIEL